MMRQEGGKRKLLLAEDDEPCRLLVAEILRGSNAKIIEAWDGASAKRLYKQHASDIVLVILDICLPGLDGFELLKYYRTINPRIPAIALSALSPALITEKCETAGFDTLISKPFDSSEFYKTIISFLKKPQQNLATAH
jgi:CheY-like chemotaxis protein